MKLCLRFNRFALALVLAVAAPLAAAAQTFTGVQSGAWWDASRNGEGQFITFETVAGRNVAYLAYFTYTASGTATWHVGNADYAAGAASISIPLVTGAGPRFGAAYNSADLTTASAGTAVLEYVSCSQMRMRHSAMPGITLNLTRLVGPLTGSPCADAIPASGLVSGPSPFPTGCGAPGGAITGTNYVNAEVEPSLAANPSDPGFLVGMWQQDRWSNGSARGLVLAVSRDGGETWRSQAMPFSTCGGGTSANGGDYERATDPWVSIGPDGTAWAMSLSTVGTAFNASSVNAMLVSNSKDGGATWSRAKELINDTAPYFNDKNAITADPFDARYVYAVWDRLRDTGAGPTMFARTTDGGATWEAAKVIFNPLSGGQTIGNLVVSPAEGRLVNVALQIVTDSRTQRSVATVIALRSEDRGLTWVSPVQIAESLAVGTRDPETRAVVRDGSIVPSAAAGPDGSVHVVWQDARFSGGSHDAIAYSRSIDGGLTWSAPARVNAVASVPAFTPAVHVLADGTIGVAYFDLRDNTPDAATLPTGYWLARSSDGGNTWTETRLAGPFDLATAPSANGLFLGDYMGLAGAVGSFLSLHTRTTGDPANRTDVFFRRASAAATSKGLGAAGEPWLALPAAPFAVSADWRARTGEAIDRALSQRGRPVPR